MRNKIIIFIIIVLSIILIPKVKANTILLDNVNTYFAINSSTSLPRNFTWSGSSSGNLTIQVGSNEFGYSYVILLVCANNNADGTTFSVSNSSYGNNYFVDGVAPVYDSNLSCKTGSNGNVDGSYKYIQLTIGKYEVQPSTGWNQYVASYLHYQNNKTWNQYITFINAMLSDEDLISEKVQQQKEHNAIMSSLSTLNSSINSLNSNINTQTQNIINNNNTNTQNIINNQNNNATQAHNDAVNTQNTIKDDNVDNPNSSINTIKNYLATNGVITNLVTLPVTLYQSILNSVNSSCSTFSLGSLYGTNLQIPCINVANYIGNTLWGTIDVIISGIFVYSISRKMVKVFNQLSSMKEGDVLDG